MLRALFIDEVTSPELVAVLRTLANAKGKPLEVAVLAGDADLTAPQRCQSALRAAGSRAALGDCMLVVRDAERAVAAQLPVLQVDDEAELPLLVAARIAGGSSANLEAALAFYLRLRQGLELSSIVSASAERIVFRALAWRAVEGKQLADLSGVFMALPVEGSVTLRTNGGVLAATVSEPSPDDLAEARNYLASLVQHGQVNTHTQGQLARATHEIVTDQAGQRRLVRLRSGAR